MRRIGWSFAVVAFLLLASCARPPLDPAAERTAREYFAAAQAADPAGIDARIAPQFAANPARFRVIDQVRAATPPGARLDARAVGWETVETPRGRRTSVLHLYRYPGVDLVVQTTLQPAGGAYRVAGLTVSRVPPEVIEANRFTLAGKSVAQYGFLFAALLSPLVMVGVALLALLTRELEWRPLWALLAFVGVGQAVINWTTGQGSFDAAQVSFINVGLSRATDIAPWILRFSPPVGALLVLVRLVFVKTREAA